MKTSFPRDKKENMQCGRAWKGGGGAEERDGRNLIKIHAMEFSKT